MPIGFPGHGEGGAMAREVTGYMADQFTAQYVTAERRVVIPGAVLQDHGTRVDATSRAWNDYDVLMDNWIA